jgi:hypothetical protein
MWTRSKRENFPVRTVNLAKVRCICTSMYTGIGLVPFFTHTVFVCACIYKGLQSISPYFTPTRTLPRLGKQYGRGDKGGWL